MSKKKNLGDLITENKENAEKLSASDIKVAFDKDKIEKKISKLILDNKQNSEELSAAYKIIATQEKEIKKQAEALIRADKEKEKQRTDLISAKKELAHKAELIILNKKLLLANKQEKLAKEKYIELYNFAPSGYFTLNREGKIIESNNFTSQILGKEHSSLKDHWFGNFVSEDTKPKFNNFLKQVFKSKTKQKCDVTLLTESELPIYIYLSGIVTKKAEQCLVTIVDITERKKTEEVVNFQKIKLELALQSAQMGTWEFNIVENKRIFDIQACFLLGIDSATFGGTAEEFFSEIHPDDLEKVKVALKKTVEQNDFYKSEYRTIWHDGSIHHISARGNLLRDDKGNPQMISGIIWDNTENKQKEEELQNSEAKHSTMISNISDVIGIIGLDGFMKYKSPNIEKWFGWQPQDLVGTDSWLTVHPDDLERIQKEFVTILGKENLTTKVEFRYKCKDGSYKPVELNAINLTNDPIINGILLNYHDITDHKQAENALKESEKRFKTIFNQAPIAITLLDTEGHTIISNLPLSNMVGYSNDELSKMKFTDFTYHEDVDKDMNQFIELIGGRISNYSMEKRFVHKNGNLVWGNLFVTIIHDENGMSNEIIGMTVDITEQKQAESELIKAKEKAEESDRLKTAFLCNMSHEIRTPMNGILGFAELLKMPGISGDEKQEYIGHIKKSSDRMLNIINDLVDISKIEAGLVKVDHDQSNINEHTEFVYTSFKLQAKAKGLNLSYRNGMPDGKVIIITDKKKVDSILSNLVKNAIKYTDNGTIEFGYKLKPIVQSSSHEVASDELEFYVKDTGIGIPVDRQQAIFDRFVQADIADTRAYQGAGLGLSIAKAYVEMLGGRIWVESEEGKGSTFYFTLPYNPVFKIKTEEDTSFSPAVTGAQINNLKILIVEDDEISVMLLMIILKKFSREILITDTGFEAIEICHSNPDIDLVLMDIKMPVMDGYEATRQIRMYNKSVVIIAQTAYGLTGDTEKAIQAGCDDYISKPISIEKLRSLINIYFA